MTAWANFWAGSVVCRVSGEKWDVQNSKRDAGAMVIALDIHCATLTEQLLGASVGNHWILGGGIHLHDS